MLRFDKPALLAECFIKYKTGSTQTSEIKINRILMDAFKHMCMTDKCPTWAVYKGHRSIHMCPQAGKFQNYDDIPSVEQYIDELLFISDEKRKYYKNHNPELVFRFMNETNFTRALYGHGPTEILPVSFDRIARRVQYKLNKCTRVFPTTYQKIITDTFIEVSKLHLGSHHVLVDMILLAHLCQQDFKSEFINQFWYESNLNDMKLYKSYVTCESRKEVLDQLVIKFNGWA